MAKIVVIADDLTGANDTGVQFAKKGFCTISLLDPRQQESGKDADVWVINAESRSLDPQEAYERNRSLAEQLHLEQIPCVYKKIDSTLRGNVGVEIDALMDSGTFDVAAIIPAYPGNRRTTVGGYHLINQILLEDSEIARDPKSPVSESHLPTLLKEQSKQPVGHIDLKAIRREPQLLIEEIRKRHAEGERLLVFDGCDQEDLRRAAKGLLASNLRILWVGSAGLAHALSDELADCTTPCLAPALNQQNESAPVFVIAGSVSAITSEQIDVLRQRNGYAIMKADPVALLNEQTRRQEMNRVAEEIVTMIDRKHTPVLITDSSQETREQVNAWMEQTGTSGLAAGNMIADCLGKLGREVLEKRPLRGFVLTGGDIAYRTCLHLDVKALQIVNEVEEGIPFSLIIGGLADKLPVVTKAGAFGNRFSLAQAVEKIYTYDS